MRPTSLSAGRGLSQRRCHLSQNSLLRGSHCCPYLSEYWPVLLGVIRSEFPWEFYLEDSCISKATFKNYNFKNIVSTIPFKQTTHNVRNQKTLSTRIGRQKVFYYPDHLYFISSKQNSMILRDTPDLVFEIEDGQSKYLKL